MQTLSEIKALLAARGLRPKDRFGQNFLHDHRKLAQIIAAADLHPGDLVLEVGPGTGVLTEALLEAGATVVAVEVDRDLAPILHERFASFSGRFSLVVEDVLAGKHKINPRVVEALRDAKPQAAAGTKFKLVANLPYNVASPLIVNLALDYRGLALGIVMVQREVAERLCAGPGGKDYGPLGILVQATCEVKRVATLSPACFWPQPKVDSAVVRLTRRATALAPDPPALAALCHRLFSKRRKQLGGILGRSTPLPEGVTPTMRPEELSIEKLVELAGMLRPD